MCAVSVLLGLKLDTISVNTYVLLYTHIPCTEHSPYIHTYLSLYCTHMNFLFSEDNVLTGNNVWKQMG